MHHHQPLLSALLAGVAQQKSFACTASIMLTFPTSIALTFCSSSQRTWTVHCTWNFLSLCACWGSLACQPHDVCLACHVHNSCPAPALGLASWNNRPGLAAGTQFSLRPSSTPISRNAAVKKRCWWTQSTLETLCAASKQTTGHPSPVSGASLSDMQSVQGRVSVSLCKSQAT